MQFHTAEVPGPNDRVKRLTFVWTILAISLLSWASAAPAARADSFADLPDSLGDNGRSFEFTPTDLTRLVIQWDGSALTLSATYAAPSFERLNVLVADAVSRNRARRCADDSADSLEVRATPSNAQLTMPYVDGTLDAAGVWEGNTVSYVFSSSLLADRLVGDHPLVCASGSTDGDDFFGGFAGKLLRITPQDATAALVAVLTRRFGTSFERSPRQWLRCPKAEIFPESDTFAASALCEFEFRPSSRRYRGGAVLFALVSGRLESSTFRSRRYTKKVRPCRIPTTKQGWDNGVVLRGRRLRTAESLGSTCRWLVGSAGMAGDLENAVAARYPRPMPRRYTVRSHGTNTAGFEDRVKYPCRVRRRSSRYTFTCSNKLGDRFVYSFSVAQKAQQPKPRNPTRTCHPSYKGACLKTNVSDYDCAGGDGDGPYYVRGPIRVVGDDPYDLDRDGNGIACET